MVRNSPTKTTRVPSSAILPINVDVDLVRFEKNLLQIGFFGANDARDKNRTTRRVEQTVMRDGNKVKVAAEFRGSEALGLPSTTDRDKFIALLKIISEERAKSGSIANPIRFSGYRLIQELGVARNGEVYEEILRWGKRMTDTTITSEQVVYRAARKVYTDETLHVFRAFRRTGSVKHDGADRQESYEVVLEDWLLENLNQRYVIPEDFNAYKLLTRPTAKGIFGNLHLWFHASAGKAVEKDYADLCNLLNVQAYPHMSKIRSTMGLALNELVSIKYVSKWDVQKMSSKDGFKIVLHPGDELLRILESNRRERRIPTSHRSEEEQLQASAPDEDARMAEAKLLAYGVYPEKAAALVYTCGSKVVVDTIEYLESSVLRTAKKKVENPAGLIIHSLEKGLPIPEHFRVGHLVREEIAEREAQYKLKVEQDSWQMEEELAYSRWVEQERSSLVGSMLTEAELQNRLKEEVRRLLRVDERFARMRVESRLEVARRGLIKALTVNCKLPSFSEWQDANRRRELFSV